MKSMNLNHSARGFLNAFFREDQPIVGGLSFRDELKALDLDYSLESLDRLDAFMDRLRETQQGREDEFIRDRANQNFQDEKAVRIVPPLWLDRDPMRRTFFRHTDIWNGGRVVWGRIVQANKLLFAPGEDDCPAGVLYDTSGKLPYTALRVPATRLFGLRQGTPANAEEKAFADFLNDEVSRPAESTCRRASPGCR